MRTILTTVGTSLLFNTANFLKKKPDEVTASEMAQYLQGETAKRASAETNSLVSMRAHNDSVILFHTDTPRGRLCASVLHTELPRRGYSAQASIVEVDLRADEAHLEMHGLRNLVEALVKAIDKARQAGDEPIINATGGFKAEVAFTTMVGLIYGVPVVYIYEEFNDVVTLPPLPIAWDMGLIADNEAFFAWIDSEPRQQADIHSRIAGLTEREAIERLLTHPDEEYCVYLNGMGELLYSRYRRDVIESEVLEDPPHAEETDPKKKVHLSPHNYINGYEEFAAKLAKVSFVEQVISGKFENTTETRVGRWNDDGQIRVVFSDGNRGDGLIVFTTARSKQTLKAKKILEDMIKKF